MKQSYLIVSVVLAANIIVAGCASTPTTQTQLSEKQSHRKNIRTVEHSKLSKSESQRGVRVVGLRSTMAGMMIDFRYQITDPAKAAGLLDIKNKAYLLVEKNGARLGVPNSVKIGSLRQTTHAKKVKKGKAYFILFGNPGGKYVKPGDKLAVVIGDTKFSNLVLQ